MKVVFSHSEATAEGIRTFWFKPDGPIDHIPGQFTRIHLPSTETDGLGDKRWFTLSSSPADELISITTKLADEPSSFKRLLSQLKSGTELVLDDPIGDFVLPKDETLPLVFIAAGIGVTPVHSMVKWLSDTHKIRDIRLIYAVSRADELAWTELFTAFPLRFIPIVKNPGASWKGETGGLDASRILQLCQPGSRTRMYLSGPEKLVEKIQADLIGQGFDDQRLITDYFHGYDNL